MDDEIIDSEEVCRMFLKDGNKMTSEEQLALFMHRFNLDRETVEVMPAFAEHCRELFKEMAKEIEK